MTAAIGWNLATSAPAAVQVVGFLVAGYAVVGNDSLQTLGTYLASNRGRTPQAVQMLFICGVLTAVLLLGWSGDGGDPAWGRLERFPPPEPFTWVVLIPPLAVLALTQWGAPVSTSFLVLAAFEPGAIGPLLSRSLLGYLLAFGVAMGLYFGVLWLLERDRSLEPGPEEPLWYGLQWLSTGWLWSQWLVQDLANIYVYLPRRLEAWQLAGSIALLCVCLCRLVAIGGGSIQEVVRDKTNTSDLRSATLIDALYGLMLFLVGQIERFPLSTTWVFLGLLGGREFALLLRLRQRESGEVGRVLGQDVFRASVGLVVSIAVALLIQPLKPLG